MYWLLSIFAIALLVMNKVCVRCSKEAWALSSFVINHG